MTGLQLLQKAQADPKLKNLPFATVASESKAHNATAKKRADVPSYIVNLRIIRTTEDHAPFSANELDVIIEHTTSATNAILDASEVLEPVSASLQAETARKLRDATTQIYEACILRDVAGQRISKAANALKAIEVKVAYILSTFEHQEFLPPQDHALSRKASSVDRSAAGELWSKPTSTNYSPA